MPRSATPGSNRWTAVHAAPTLICLSCGGELGPTLAGLASLRCHDCRDSGAPLDADLVADARLAGEAPASRAA
jgi:hypothetical protein